MLSWKQIDENVYELSTNLTCITLEEVSPDLYFADILACELNGEDNIIIDQVELDGKLSEAKNKTIVHLIHLLQDEAQKLLSVVTL